MKRWGSKTEKEGRKASEGGVIEEGASRLGSLFLGPSDAAWSTSQAQPGGLAIGSLSKPLGCLRKP